MPQGVDVMGPRGPPPLMAPRPLMGAELWQQMPRGSFGKSPRPLMRPGAAVRVSVQWVVVYWLDLLLFASSNSGTYFAFVYEFMDLHVWIYV